MMKLFVVLAFFAVAVNCLTDEQKEKLKRHQAQCLTESGVNMALVQKMHGGDFTMDDQDLMEFSLCMLIKSELMTKEGTFKKDIALAKIPVEADRPAVETIIDGCLALKADTPELTAWNFMKCYHEKNPKHPIV